MTDQDLIKLLVERHKESKEEYQEVIQRAENKRTAGQIIRAEERYKTLQKICNDLGIPVD